jgi:hypothetical protein
MPIRLETTCAQFDRSLLRALPALEQTMRAHGLDPDDCLLSKAPAVTANVPFVGPLFYDYTVTIGDARFTVTEPSDSRFLETARCVDGRTTSR